MVLEHNARWVVYAQVQQAWAQIVELEGPARGKSQEVALLLGDARAGQGAIQERAKFVLMMEAAVASRKRGQLPRPAWWRAGRTPKVRIGG